MHFVIYGLAFFFAITWTWALVMIPSNSAFTNTDILLYRANSFFHAAFLTSICLKYVSP